MSNILTSPTKARPGARSTWWSAVRVISPGALTVVAIEHGVDIYTWAHALYTAWAAAQGKAA